VHGPAPRRRPPAQRVAGRHASCVEVAHVADEGGERGELGGFERRPASNALQAVGDDANEVVVGGRVAEPAAAKVNAGNLVAGRPMALRALPRTTEPARMSAWLCSPACCTPAGAVCCAVTAALNITTRRLQRRC
jgi:hypothetical protein